MVTSFVEGFHPGEYIVSEGRGHISRDVGLITGGVNLYPGTVLGKITASGKYVQLNPTANDGSQNAAAILFGVALAAGGDVEATITTRLAEVNGAQLTWPVGITGTEQAAATALLAAADIIIRF